MHDLKKQSSTWKDRPAAKVQAKTTRAKKAQLKDSESLQKSKRNKPELGKLKLRGLQKTKALTLAIWHCTLSLHYTYWRAWLKLLSSSHLWIVKRIKDKLKRKCILLMQLFLKLLFVGCNHTTELVLDHPGFFWPSYHLLDNSSSHVAD